MDQARFSSSALDTEGFLLQLGLFWKNLEWPIATDAIGYLCTIIEVSMKLCGKIMFLQASWSLIMFLLVVAIANFTAVSVLCG